MKDEWTAYDENVKKMVNVIDPELVSLKNGKKQFLEKVKNQVRWFLE